MESTEEKESEDLVRNRTMSVCIICSEAGPKVPPSNNECQEKTRTSPLPEDEQEATLEHDEYLGIASLLPVKSEEDREHIMKFLKEVLQLDKKKTKKGSSIDESDLKILESLPFCENCVTVIGTVVDKKMGADELEEQVRQLELQVLEEKRKLEVQLKAFYLEMKRMEEIIMKSDKARLKETLKIKKKENLDGALEGGDEMETEKESAEGELPRDEIKEKVTPDDTDDKLEDDGDEDEEEIENYFPIVNFFRKSIFQAVRKLDQLHNDNEDSDKRKRRRRVKTELREGSQENGDDSTDDLIIPLLHCAVKTEYPSGDSEDEKESERPAGRRKTGMAIPEFDMEEIIKDEPIEDLGSPRDDTEDIDDRTDPLSDPLDLGDCTVENEVINKNMASEDSTDRPARKRRKIKVVSEDDVVESILSDEDDDNEEVVEPSDDEDFVLEEGEDIIGSESSSTTTDSEDSGSGVDEDWDDKKLNERKIKKKKQKEQTKETRKEEKRKVPKMSKTPKTSSEKQGSGKAAYHRCLNSIDFSAMSKLKCMFIRRILQKKFLPPPVRKSTPGQQEVPDPREGHYIDYDNQQDSFSMEGIAIKVTEEKIKPGDDPTDDCHLTLECSTCGWSIKPPPNSKRIRRRCVETFMYNHIASQHLKLFQCALCGSNIGEYKRYVDHMLGHRNKFVCDICGRPLGGKQALIRHKWFHLNEDEVAALVAQGHTDLRKKKASTKSYPCPKCGKTFPQRCHLKNHEKTHDESRERVTCEMCGKSFLPGGLWSHKRKYCTPPGMERHKVTCMHCPKEFTNLEFLQDHIERFHKTERDYKCEYCGKGFKTRKDMRLHSLHMHQGTGRTYTCRKGCSKVFKLCTSRNTHEKKCDGRGGKQIQKFLDGQADRPYICQKGCGKGYTTSKSRRCHEKTCKGIPFFPEAVVAARTEEPPQQDFLQQLLQQQIYETPASQPQPDLQGQQQE